MSDVLVRANESISQLDTAVHVYGHGVRAARSARFYPEVIGEIRKRYKEQHGKELPLMPREFELETFGPKMAEFAESEAASGSPYLYSLGIVRLWSILETFVGDVALIQLKYRKEALQSKALRSIQVPAVEFLAAEEDERLRSLFVRLREATRAPLQIGAGKFEALLDAVAIGGPIHAPVRKALLELSQLRNAIVHTAGRADSRLLEACPWLELKEGDPINPQEIQFDLFVYSSDWYTLELARRFTVAFDAEEAGHQAKLREDMANLVDLVWKRRDEARTERNK